MKKKKILIYIIIIFSSNIVFAETDFIYIEKYIGKQDSALIADTNGKIIFEKNAKKKLIPASILKIFTSALALAYLGENYKFKTEFYLDDKNNLKIKGYGDPFLTSVQLKEIAKNLKTKINKINNIVFDESFYAENLHIDGINDNSLEPFDAPNSAICVNFNTVAYKKKNNLIIQGELETPIIDYIIPKIEKTNENNGRISLSKKNNENLLYAGKLFEYFLTKEGIAINGKINFHKIKKHKDKLIYRHYSPYALKEIIKNLLEYSNNFIANQIFLNVGAKIYGEPATIQKSIEAAKLFAKNKLSIKNISAVEGSGISRKNKLSAFDMLKILNEFEKNHTLMKKYKKNLFYKTGTLNGIKTRAGFFKKNNNIYRIILIINTKDKAVNTIFNKIIKSFSDKRILTTIKRRDL